jgi:hypothetical protein
MEFVLTGERLLRYQTSAGRVHAREWADVQGAGDVSLSSIRSPTEDSAEIL